MKSYIKSFFPSFRPIKGTDASFDLQDFEDAEFDCPIKRGDVGIYIISSTDGTKYTYPNGKKNPIIYIGKSDDLLRRLKDHYNCNLKLLLNDRDWGIDNNVQLLTRYQYMCYNGSHVDVFVCRGKQDAKDLESKFLNQFYKKYRALPVGNGARSF